MVEGTKPISPYPNAFEPVIGAIY